ncbi:hypothetical protein Patl1_14152 [Pistacia atlantica]|uniref:Uncharacterized protein n=1 Tax=Pistacia atlantica TaxID=434234 RepID=A0ACC1AX41_9ROSI|nr:hypothetical protein Patl1_14152 [Pistacia atlantica]
MAAATTITTADEQAPTENGSTNAPELDPQPALNPTTDSVESPQNENPDPDSAEATDPPTTTVPTEKRWPGWPGHCVYRLIVPVLKVGSIIGRKGELIKKMCEETRARIKVLDGPVGNPDRIVLISGKEELEAPVSPAMDAAIRIFKRVSGLPENDGDAKAATAAFCSVRLLVASTQAINLIGKQGSLIKSIQESTGASVRVLSGEEVPFYAATDERVVEMQGEAVKVLKALEAVVGHLRKFLVDHSVLPLFEKTYNTAISQERQVETWADKSSLHNAHQSGIGSEYTPSTRRESLYLEHEPQLESHFRYSGISLYGQDPSISAIRSSGVARASGPIVTQVAQTMQIPISYAEDIIGIGGNSIEHIRRTSGAIITVQESRGLPDEITVEIKGSSSQVQMAQQLIQEFMNNHKEPVTSSYGKIDTGYRSSYSHLGSSSYSSSSLSSQPYGGYGSSGVGGYGSSGVGGYSSYRL